MAGLLYGSSCFSNLLIAAVLLLVSVAEAAGSECDIYRPQQAIDAMNANSVGFATGAPTGRYATMGYDLASLMEDRCSGKPFRVVITLSAGSYSNIDDMKNLKRIDIGLVQSDVLADLAKTEPARLKSDIQYIAPLHHEVIHILAGPAIRSYRDLNGKTVNADRQGSGSQITAGLIFPLIGVTPNKIDFTPKDQAVRRLISGELDAMVFVAARGAPFTTLKPEQLDAGKLHFVALPHSLTAMAQTYVPAELTTGDYGGHVDASERVDTWAVQAVLAVYGWPASSPRYRPVAEFVDRLFSSVAALGDQKYGGRWCEVDLAGRVANWKRFEAVDQWLIAHPSAQTQPCAPAAPGDCQAGFVSELQQKGVSPDFRLSYWQDAYAAWRAKNKC